jgi:phosphopantetheinyl transferase
MTDEQEQAEAAATWDQVEAILDGFTVHNPRPGAQRAADLVAEVKRLRALEADAERARVKADLWSYYEAFVTANGAGSITELVVQRDEARAEAARKERAAVVAWLNNAADTVYYDCCCGPVAACADAIERGEHRREEETRLRAEDRCLP